MLSLQSSLLTSNAQQYYIDAMEINRDGNTIIPFFSVEVPGNLLPMEHFLLFRHFRIEKSDLIIFSLLHSL